MVVVEDAAGRVAKMESLLGVVVMVAVKQTAVQQVVVVFIGAAAVVAGHGGMCWFFMSR